MDGHSHEMNIDFCTFIVHFILPFSSSVYLPLNDFKFVISKAAFASGLNQGNIGV
jgi:hypothetical protein